MSAAADALTVTATAMAPTVVPLLGNISGIRLGLLIAGSIMVGAIIGSFINSERVNKVLNDILTGKDGKSYDFIKVIGIPVIAAAIHLTYISVIFNPAHAFDVQAFGIGMGGLLFGIGAGVGMKKATEPEA